MTRPQQKYNKGDWIKTNSGREGRICEDPEWNDWCERKPQWYYTYEYGLGGTSEGSILELDIRYKIDLSK